jgi:hypothetical protein
MYLDYSLSISRPNFLLASVKVSVCFFTHLRRVSCHHSMVRPRAEEGGKASSSGG